MTLTMSNEVCKSGIVTRVDEHKIVVSLIRTEACGSCQLKGTCHSTTSKVQEVDVPRKHGQNFEVGEKVEVVISEGKAVLAVVLSFVIPVFLLLTVFLIVKSLQWNDGFSALVAVGVTAVYYFVLYLMKSKLGKTFHFTLRKNDSIN